MVIFMKCERLGSLSSFVDEFLLTSSGIAYILLALSNFDLWNVPSEDTDNQSSCGDVFVNILFAHYGIEKKAMINPESVQNG